MRDGEFIKSYQCSRCQSYSRQPRCRRCGTTENSNKDCREPIHLPAKYIFCKEAHPSNCEGCTVYKQMQTKNTHHYDKKIPRPATTRMVCTSNKRPPRKNWEKNSYKFKKLEETVSEKQYCILS